MALTADQKREIREQEKSLLAEAVENLPPVPGLSSLGVLPSQSTEGEATVGAETSTDAGIRPGEAEIAQQVQRVVIELQLITDILTALPKDIADALGDI
jgi:hypothetical protein